MPGMFSQSSSDLLGEPVAIQDLFCVIIFYLSGVAQNFVVCRLQQLLAAIMELGTNRLLHPRVGQIALSRWLLRNQFHDTETSILLRRRVHYCDNRTVLPRLQLKHQVPRAGIGVAQRGLRNCSQISAVAGSLGILGIVHRERCEVIPAIQPVRNHLNLLAGIGFVLRFVVLVVYLRVGRRGYEDLRQVVLRFDEVEFRFVRGKIIRDVLVANIDFRRYFLVHHFVDGDGAAYVALEIVQGNLLFLEPLVEFFLRVGGLDLVELTVYFFFRGQQAELFGAAHDHFIVDHLAQNVEAENRGLLAGWLLLSAGYRIFVILVDVRAEDFAAIDSRHHVTAYLRLAAQQRCQQNGRYQQRCEPCHISMFFQRFSPA